MTQKRRRPGIDGAIAPRLRSRDGQPISYNRAPAPDLAPWIARLYAAVVDAPADHCVACGLFNDTSVFRIQLKGRWTAETADGPHEAGRAALFFGPQTRRMPVTVTGSFVSVGILLRPGSGHALIGARTADHLDRMVSCDAFGLPGEAALRILESSDDPEQWLQMLEGLIRQIVASKGGQPPDPVTVLFESLVLTDPTRSVADFARERGIDQRRLERIVRRDFGMSPKQVLRRARAIDMASHFRGVADHEEADQLALRYYDQSHLIREFTELFGMSPKQFIATPQPILTLALESRQAWRLEALQRLAPGATRPWQ